MAAQDIHSSGSFEERRDSVRVGVILSPLLKRPDLGSLLSVLGSCLVVGTGLVVSLQDDREFRYLVLFLSCIAIAVSSISKTALLLSREKERRKHDYLRIRELERLVDHITAQDMPNAAHGPGGDDRSLRGQEQ